MTLNFWSSSSLKALSVAFLAACLALLVATEAGGYLSRQFGEIPSMTQILRFSWVFALAATVHLCIKPPTQFMNSLVRSPVNYVWLLLATPLLGILYPKSAALIIIIAAGVFGRHGILEKFTGQNNCYPPKILLSSIAAVLVFQVISVACVEVVYSSWLLIGLIWFCAISSVILFCIVDFSENLSRPRMASAGKSLLAALVLAATFVAMNCTVDFSSKPRSEVDNHGHSWARDSTERAAFEAIAFRMNYDSVSGANQSGCCAYIGVGQHDSSIQ